MKLGTIYSWRPLDQGTAAHSWKTCRDGKSTACSTRVRLCWGFKPRKQEGETPLMLRPSALARSLRGGGRKLIGRKRRGTERKVIEGIASGARFGGAGSSVSWVPMPGR
jgi:hypothetical protein